MKKELDEKLMKRFGFLYRDRSLPATKTTMCWGFECGDGWFNILWNLSAGIEELLNALPEETRQSFAVEQVKEKYGTLRFYCHGPTDNVIWTEIEKLVALAEEASAVTCDRCGGVAKANVGAWVRVICAPCEHIEREEYEKGIAAQRAARAKKGQG